MQRIAMNQGTPLKPDVPVDVYVFALFNEDMKPGPTSERNYGLFYPNGSPVYAINAGSGVGSNPGWSFNNNPYYSSMLSSSSKLAVRTACLTERVLLLLLLQVIVLLLQSHC
uniref:Glucan endo-1,3-beta-D-glucosidase n=1 Tax=Arundo donax TaxID=35708 RepID=A0A0A9GBH5_ARUDO